MIQSPLAVATDGYISPVTSRTIAIVSRGYILLDGVVELPVIAGGGLSRRDREHIRSIEQARREAKRQRLEELKRRITVKSVREVVEKVEIDRLDLKALELAIRRAVETAQEIEPRRRKFDLDLDISEITLPVVEPGRDDFNLRLLLLAGW